MTKAEEYDQIFKGATEKYQKKKDIDAPSGNPFPEGSLPHLLYEKAWIDNRQWDLEDLIRVPDIQLKKAIHLKRRIDASNQNRTDLVEKIDDYFLEQFKDIDVQPQARLNTESIAWALDRLSILNLKIYHMGLQMKRTDALKAHKEKCDRKLSILKIQKKDLLLAINQLIEDILAGKRKMKVYRQMKMYNDPSMNPHLSSEA